eukprot:TCALIF_06422-PA protein Name:"Similar to Lac Lachesin (Drosophila melanogaster)" AED:0.14 eAED:0.14 QI:0/0.87/0.66/0.88/0.87/1/9/0/429
MMFAEARRQRDQFDMSNELDLLPRDPEFVNHVPNMTVAIGRDVDLDCQVKNVGEYKVGWMKAEDQTVLTLHKRVITHNSRIRVTHDEHRTWTLKIVQVQLEDQGCYMCQINTAVMMKQSGCLNVLVPPDIDSARTTSDVTVSESQNAVLFCKAYGQPVPTITWRKENGKQFIIKDGSTKKKVQEYSGEELHLHKIKRQDMGAFMCIANNGVPPTVSQRVVLNVNFEPTIEIKNQVVGCPVGKEVVLQCSVEAYPNPHNYWQRSTTQGGDHEIIMAPNHSPDFEITNQVSSYRSEMTFKIKRFAKADAGTYTCISTNSLGRKEGTIRLYEIIQQTDAPWISFTESSYSAEEIEETYGQRITHDNKRDPIQNISTKDTYTLNEKSHPDSKQNEKKSRKDRMFANSEPNRGIASWNLILWVIAHFAHVIWNN